MPPLRPVPGVAESLEVRQVGNRLRLSWKAPSRNQDETTAEVNLMEARISRRVVELPSEAPEPPSEPPTDVPPEEALPPAPIPPRPIATPFDPEASMVSTVESRELGAERFYEDVVEPAWIGKRVEYLVVYANRRNRVGPPSTVVSIDPRAELARPVAPAAEPGDGFVSLQWSAPEGADESYGYAVFRRLQDEARYGDAPLNPEPLPEPRFEDRSAAFGTPVCYVVTSVAVTPPVEPVEPGEPDEPDPDAPATVESRGSIESGPSEEVCLTPEDRFAPEVPSGLVAVPSSDGILLTWRASASVDVRGYRVYRSDSASGDFSFLGEVDSASYNDAAVAPGETRFYVVTAIDDAPAVNESEKSAVAEATRPQ
jgi:hypothetical protein